MRKLPLSRTPHPPLRRGGTTLTEVLMALLCMGIGVVAVASLFPIALLRSAQATQLTSATILRFNAETLIDLYDEVPIPDPTTFRNLVLNPDYFRQNPNQPPTIPVNPADDFNFQEHFSKNYVIDPLGAMIVRSDNGKTITTTDNIGPLPRYDALRIFYPTPTYTNAAAALQQAEAIVALPDSWVRLYDNDEFPIANDQTSITLPATTKVQFSELQAMLPPTGRSEVRIVLFDASGHLSETRPLAAASFATANTISWANSLPSNNQYYPNKVSRIRLEVKERRYTWLLTVRNDTPITAADAAAAHARVDVVVFFRRSPSLAEETPYLLTGGGKNYVVGNIASGAWPYSTAPYSSPYPSPYPAPFLKKGGFMLDTFTGTWHRVQKVNDSTQTIALERNTGNLNGHHVVFMKGVVDVYSLGAKP